MPLKNLNVPGYLKRTRIYVNSDEKDIERSNNNYDFIFNLNNEIQNVVSIELTSWNIHKRIAPTFMGRYIQSVVPYPSQLNPRSIIPGTSMMDIEMIDETGVQSVTFPVDLELVGVGTLNPISLSGTLSSIATIIATLQIAIPEALDNEGHGLLNTTNYTLNIGIDNDSRFYFYAHRIGFPLLQAQLRILFKTGLNQLDSMHRVLGFNKIDTIPNTITSGIQSLYSIETTPYRYIDVNILNIPELTPNGRIYLTNETDYVKPYDTPEKPRLLVEPIKKLNELRIKLTLPENESFNHEILTGYDLEFEILSLSPESCIPNWVNQSLTY